MATIYEKGARVTFVDVRGRSGVGRVKWDTDAMTIHINIEADSIDGAACVKDQWVIARLGDVQRLG